MLIESICSEDVDHEFKTLLVYFNASSMCSVEIYNKSIDTNEVQSVYWEKHRLKSQKTWIFILALLLTSHVTLDKLSLSLCFLTYLSIL